MCHPCWNLKDNLYQYGQLRTEHDHLSCDKIENPMLMQWYTSRFIYVYNLQLYTSRFNSVKIDKPWNQTALRLIASISALINTVTDQGVSNTRSVITSKFRTVRISIVCSRREFKDDYKKINLRGWIRRREKDYYQETHAQENYNKVIGIYCKKYCKYITIWKITS